MFDSKPVFFTNLLQNKTLREYYPSTTTFLELSQDDNFKQIVSDIINIENPIYGVNYIIHSNEPNYPGAVNLQDSVFLSQLYFSPTPCGMNLGADGRPLGHAFPCYTIIPLQNWGNKVPITFTNTMGMPSTYTASSTTFSKKGGGNILKKIYNLFFGKNR